MKKKMNASRNIKYVVLAAVVPSLAILSAGTFAWQSLSQRITNENALTINPGGRLHDDFNGKNKDVYAENYTSKDEEGQPLYVRIRFSEYMETGPDAGIDKENEGRDVTPLIEGSKISDTSTWNIHKPEDVNPELCSTIPSFHDYWTWELGGSTVYMPTFNKDKDSLEADINGTWDSVGEDDKHYSDYKAYTEGQQEIANARYSKDSAHGTAVKDGEENVLYKEAEETHTAKMTQEATVMTMQEWMAAGAIPGRYWVWDSDGWAYWAEALQPEEATGCLLTGIKQKSYTTGEVYYAIDVVGEFATAFDWGDQGDEENGTGAGATGFYEKGMTEDGKNLLDRIASVVEGDDGYRYLDCGNNTYRQIRTAGNLGELFCAGLDRRPGNSDDQTNLIQLGEELIVDGTNCGTLFLGPGENQTYWAMGQDRLIGTEDDIKIWYFGEDTFPGDPVNEADFSLIGADELILNGLPEDMKVEANQTLTLETIVQLKGNRIENQKVTWTLEGGTSGTTIDPETKQLKIAANETIGKELILNVRSDVDVEHAFKTIRLTVAGPDEVSITSGGKKVTDTIELAQGKSQTFVATVKRGGKTYSNNQVTWKLTGKQKSGTTLVDGKLTVAEDEPSNQLLTIQAIAVNAPKVSASFTVKVKFLSKFDDITPGSTTTVTIDGTEFYVLAKNGDETLLYAKEPVGTCVFGSSNVWNSSCMLYQTMTSWLNGKTTLKAKAVSKTIYTRATYNDYTKYNSMSCKVFALSEADLFGTANGSASNITKANESKEYTYNGQQLITSDTIKGWTNTTNGSVAWLRSPKNDANHVAGVHNVRLSGYSLITSVYGVRPALWVKGL